MMIREMNQVNDLQLEILRQVHDNIPLCPKPFEAIARKLGIDEQKVLDELAKMLQDGIIRRFGAVIRHYNVGYSTNAMVVWDVPDDKVAKIGNRLKGYKRITHCYQRVSTPEFPYSLYTMIHANDERELAAFIEKLKGIIGDHPHFILRTVRELKKSSFQVY